MSYQACEDCGTRLYGNICSNCQEELYIYQFQGSDAVLSDEFMEKVGEQVDQVRARTQSVKTARMR